LDAAVVKMAVRAEAATGMGRRIRKTTVEAVATKPRPEVT
jgi:hypothetical protein